MKKKSASILVLVILLSLPIISYAKPSSISGKNISYQIDPETFSLEIIKDSDKVLASKALPTAKVSKVSQSGNQLQWSYPDKNIEVLVQAQENYLEVKIISTSQEDNEFAWPSIAGEFYYLPFGEGKRIPANEQTWVNYLSGQEFGVLDQLSMPFWATVHGKYAVTYILENPFRNTLNFAKTDRIAFSLTQYFPEIDPKKEKTFRIYLSENKIQAPAKIYRDYVIAKGDFLSLEQKAAKQPDIRKLYGAPHIYLAGDLLIGPENINWQAFRQAINTPEMHKILSFASKIENGKEMQTTIQELAKQDYASQYQKNLICSYLSLLLQTSLLSPNIQDSKENLAKLMPKVFNPVDTWMDNQTVDLIKDFKDSGIKQAWIGLHSWQQALAKPELTARAIAQGYLVATYDSYHSIHKPGQEQWNTAAFTDQTLYENATVTNKNGEKVAGYKNVGLKLNPTLSLPTVKERLNWLTSEAKFNSWFIDCDATGEIYDDYSATHPNTPQEDLQARLERMVYIRDQHNMVIGSEGGHDFAASTIAFAHGIELRTFAWSDPDMSKNKESKYYLGKYYSPNGGVPEHFAKRVPIKQNLLTIFVDPKYDIPLFKLVYNDSLITTYHWDWSTFKIQGLTKDRMLREILYNVPPLYHLDSVEWKKYKEDILAHTKVWSEFSQEVISKEMSAFENLTPDGSVQMTGYGDETIVVANFAEQSYAYNGKDIPAHSLIIINGKNVHFYSPQVKTENQ